MDASQSAEYLEKHGVMRLFESLLQALVLNKPKDPLEFLVKQLQLPPLPRLIVIGGPASGKTSLCTELMRTYGMILVSSAEILREAAKDTTDTGKKIRLILDQGELVPDELITPLVIAKLKATTERGKVWILSGFPRTRAQAFALQDAGLLPSAVIQLNSTMTHVLERGGDRKYDPVSREFLFSTDLPKDSVPKERLEKRADDTLEKLRRRMNDYEKNAGPVSECFKNDVYVIDATKDRPDIINNIENILPLVTIGNVKKLTPEELKKLDEELKAEIIKQDKAREKVKPPPPPPPPRHPIAHHPTSPLAKNQAHPVQNGIHAGPQTRQQQLPQHGNAHVAPGSHHPVPPVLAGAHGGAHGGVHGPSSLHQPPQQQHQHPQAQQHGVTHNVPGTLFKATPAVPKAAAGHPTASNPLHKPQVTHGGAHPTHTPPAIFNQRQQQPHGTWEDDAQSKPGNHSAASNQHQKKQQQQQQQQQQQRDEDRWEEEEEIKAASKRVPSADRLPKQRQQREDGDKWEEEDEIKAASKRIPSGGRVPKQRQQREEENWEDEAEIKAASKRIPSGGRERQQQQRDEDRWEEEAEIKQANPASKRNTPGGATASNQRQRGEDRWDGDDQNKPPQASKRNPSSGRGAMSNDTDDWNEDAQIKSNPSSKRNPSVDRAPASNQRQQEQEDEWNEDDQTKANPFAKRNPTSDRAPVSNQRQQQKEDDWAEDDQNPFAKRNPSGGRAATSNEDNWIDDAPAIQPKANPTVPPSGARVVPGAQQHSSAAPHASSIAPPIPPSIPHRAVPSSSTAVEFEIDAKPIHPAAPSAAAVASGHQHAPASSHPAPVQVIPHTFSPFDPQPSTATTTIGAHPSTHGTSVTTTTMIGARPPSNSTAAPHPHSRS